MQLGFAKTEISILRNTRPESHKDAMRLYSHVSVIIS